MRSTFAVCQQTGSNPTLSSLFEIGNNVELKVDGRFQLFAGGADMPWSVDGQSHPEEEQPIGLQLPQPERDIVITSQQVDGGLQNRVRDVPSRQLISFRIEELEDLHRGLAFDASQTPDKKREKTIRKILRKIEHVLDNDDEEGLDAAFEPKIELGDRRLTQRNQHEFLVPALDDAFDSPLSIPVCPVSLTLAQRKLLCAMDTISLDVHKMLTIDSEEEREFSFNPRQVMVISLARKGSGRTQQGPAD